MSSDDRERINSALCLLLYERTTVDPKELIAACELLSFSEENADISSKAMRVLVNEVAKRRDKRQMRATGNRIARIVSDEQAPPVARRAAYAALCLFSLYKSNASPEDWPDFPDFPRGVNWDYVRGHQKAGVFYAIVDYSSILMNRIWRFLGIPGCR